VIVPDSVDEKVYSGVESLVGVATAVTSAISGAVVAVSTSSSRLMQEVRRSIEKMMSRFFTWFTIWNILVTQYVLRNGCQKYINLLKIYVFTRRSANRKRLGFIVSHLGHKDAASTARYTHLSGE